MSVADYLKQVAAQLRRAADEGRRETRELDADIDRRAKMLNDEINAIEAHIRAKEIELTLIREDMLRTQRATQIQDLRRQIDDLRYQFDKEKQEILNSRRLKEADINNYEAQARDFDRRATQT